MNIGLLASAAGIILVDLALSGDNALVIAAAAARLPRAQQRMAILWGGIAALVLRFALATVATELLTVPLLRALGGLVILVIAVRLLLPEDAGEHHERRAHDRLTAAIVTILLADVTMSLDNVLAVGALANGNLGLLAAGLALSMVLLFAASALVAALIGRLAWLMDVAALVLGWTAGRLIVDDQWVAHAFPAVERTSWPVYAGCVLVVVIADIWLRLKRRRSNKEPPAESPAAGMGMEEAEETPTPDTWPAPAPLEPHEPPEPPDAETPARRTEAARRRRATDAGHGKTRRRSRAGTRP